MQEFVRRCELQNSLGAPSGPQFIHVAGTNGKGSTTAFLQSLFVEAGFRTGSFFSPFVVVPRERVQFNRDLISESELADLTTRLIPIAESLSDTPFGGITEFEFKTALGFEYWKDRQCEWVALEVGLGGRLDATNVVVPRASVVVSIGLDHVQILGNTEAQIAYEKAGVIKQGVPVIVGNLSPEALEVVETVAKEHDAPIWRWGHEVTWIEADSAVKTPVSYHSGLYPSLIGEIQKHNLALAVAAIVASGANVTDQAVVLGAQSASIPGRFQVMQLEGKTIVFDGAHNVDSAKVLRDALIKRYGVRKIRLVTHMLSGHEPAEFYAVFQDLVTQTYVVPVDFFRATPVTELANVLRPIFKDVIEFDNSTDGFHAAVEAASEDEIVVVTGTFYLVGDLLRAIKLPDTGSQ